ncbi:MAG: hypothetical protein NT069_22005 [Planctomycetota bacterium]|nr:hypothetical protein [Planctomycetota bacterium]
MHDIFASDFAADDSVADQFHSGANRFKMAGTHFVDGTRVTKKTVRTAKDILKKSRTKTVAGKQKALIKGGVASPSEFGARLNRNAPAKKLTPAQRKVAKTVAKQGNIKGLTTSQVLAQARGKKAGGKRAAKKASKKASKKAAKKS